MMTATNRPRHRFARNNQVVECRGCGKRTTEFAGGNAHLNLCRACADDAGMENEHSDGHHEGNPHPGCRWCKA